MRLPEEGQLLRVFIGEDDKYKGKPLYEVIVEKARELNLAGATVMKGTMGYGAHSRLHTSKVLRLSESLPVVIEIVDKEERINLLLPFIDEHVKEGLVTIEEIKIIQYRHNEHNKK